jgi:hypothetical protein
MSNFELLYIGTPIILIIIAGVFILTYHLLDKKGK